MIVHDHHNLRFTLYEKPPGRGEPDRPAIWILNVTRISDGHRLKGGQSFWTEEATTRLPELAEAWILHAAGNEEPEPTPCQSCGATLVTDYDSDYQFDNALWIDFGGGYGMAIDPIEDAAKMKVVICHTCFHDLCDAVPWIGDLLQPTSSHSHRMEESPVLLEQGHEGWDLNRYRVEDPTHRFVLNTRHHIIQDHGECEQWSLREDLNAAIHFKLHNADWFPEMGTHQPDHDHPFVRASEPEA